MIYSRNKSSHAQLYCKKAYLKNLAKFKGMHFYQRLFLIKSAACKFIKRANLVQGVFYEFWETSQKIFFFKHVWATASVDKNWLLLYDFSHALDLIVLSGWDIEIDILRKRSVLQSDNDP